jgi:hypothetical protein
VKPFVLLVQKQFRPSCFVTTERALSDDARHLHNRFCGLTKSGATASIIKPIDETALAIEFDNTIEWKANLVSPKRTEAELVKLKKKDLIALVKVLLSPLPSSRQSSLPGYLALISYR